MNEKINMTKENKIVFGKLDQMRNHKIFKENRIPIGFIGGGDNSFIGYTHRLAATFDKRFICGAGVFSRDKSKSKEFAQSLGIDSSRALPPKATKLLLSSKIGKMILLKK